MSYADWTAMSDREASFVQVSFYTRFKGFVRTYAHQDLSNTRLPTGSQCFNLSLLNGDVFHVAGLEVWAYKIV